MKMRLVVAVLISVVAVACQDKGAKRDTDVIKESVQQIKEEQEEQQSPKVSRDKRMEMCADISEEQMEAVEKKMQNLQSRSAMLSGNEMLILRCSRLRQKQSR